MDSSIASKEKKKNHHNSVALNSADHPTNAISQNSNGLHAIVDAAALTEKLIQTKPSTNSSMDSSKETKKPSNIKNQEKINI